MLTATQVARAQMEIDLALQRQQAQQQAEAARQMAAQQNAAYAGMGAAGNAMYPDLGGGNPYLDGMLGNTATAATDPPATAAKPAAKVVTGKVVSSKPLGAARHEEFCRALQLPEGCGS